MTHTYRYDHRRRQKTDSVSVRRIATGVYTDTAVAVMRNSYNELGRRILFRPGNESAVLYEYNLRGQLISLGSRYLIQKLFYETGKDSCNYYNGNISAMQWRIYGMPSGEKWRYDYYYDTLDRLTSAKFKVEADQGVSASHADYSTDYTYDLNSNLKSLNRKGPFSLGGNPEYGYVDNLTMTLDGNRIVSVKEGADEVILEGSLDYPSANSDAIRSYDLCGRLIKDPAHGIERIHYNPAGQPIKIEMKGNNTFYMVYNADGNRLAYSRRTPNNGSIPFPGFFSLDPQSSYPGLNPGIGASFTHIFLSRIFHGAVTYKNGELERINLPEGYITPNGTFNAYYHDYQGNVRAVGTGGEYGAPLQITHYYPYGLPFAEGIGASVNRYKYTGKELITEDNLNFYDFEARLQWPDLPAFNRPDPMEEEYTWFSPYTFCATNPVMCVDWNGEMAIYIRTTNNESENALRSFSSQIDTPFLAVVGHGTSNGIGSQNSEGYPYITSAEEFDAYILKHHQINITPEKQNLIVLHSCNTGKGENSFASKLSKYYSKSIVVAPMGYISLGVLEQQQGNNPKQYTVKNETVKKNRNGDDNPIEKWGIFINGVLVSTINGQVDITKVINSMYRTSDDPTRSPIIPIDPLDIIEPEKEDEEENAKTMEHLNYLMLESWKMGATINIYNF